MIVMDGPASPGCNGCPFKITYAVIIFVTLAIGLGTAAPLDATVPRPTTDTVADPADGIETCAAVPTTVDAGTVVVDWTAGNPRSIWNAAIARTRTSGARRKSGLIEERRLE
jgi:hypothetical protein